MTLHPSMWDKLFTYLVYEKKFDNSHKSVDRRKSLFLTMCRYFDGREFTRESFTEFIKYLLEKGYTKEYANTFIKLAKHIDKCYKLGQLDDYSLFPRQPKVIDWLSYDEIKAMAEVDLPYHAQREEKNLKYKAIITTLLLTGARIAEVLDLRWENLKDNPYCLIIEQNKTRDMRIAPISKELYDTLHRLPKTSGYIFANRDGKRMDETVVNDDVKRRALAVGINKRVYNHLIRHSFVNIMLRSGTPMHVVSRLVGHKDIATTNEYYTHIMIEELSDFLHAFHPHLRDTQTLDSIRKRLDSFLAVFVNKDKFRHDVRHKENVITVEVKEHDY